MTQITWPWCFFKENEYMRMQCYKQTTQTVDIADYVLIMLIKLKHIQTSKRDLIHQLAKQTKHKFSTKKNQNNLIIHSMIISQYIF